MPGCHLVAMGKHEVGEEMIEHAEHGVLALQVDAVDTELWIVQAGVLIVLISAWDRRHVELLEEDAEMALGTRL